MKFRSQSSTLLLVLFLMAAAVLLRIVWVRLPDVQNDQQRTLLIEIAKTLLQLAVIAVIGGAPSPGGGSLRQVAPPSVLLSILP